MWYNEGHYVFWWFQKYKAEVAKLELALKEKTRENKRLKDNFETLKMANDAQKKEVLLEIKIRLWSYIATDF